MLRKQHRVVVMYRVRVTDVLNGNTIAVWPQWTLQGESGSLVQIHGLRTPSEGTKQSDEAYRKLIFLVLGSDVCVMRVHGRVDRALVCDVDFRGRNLTKHLPEYATAGEVVSPVSA